MQKTTARAPRDPFSEQIAALRAQANEVKLTISDLEVRKNQLGEQRRSLSADIDHSRIDKQLADAEHNLAAARIQLESMDAQIHDLESTRDIARLGIGTTAMPPMPPEPLIGREQVMMGGFGVFILLVPMVLAYTRRIWKRGGRVQSANPEDSERLLRMEQAIESIALEVERIGEGQRFTTKLLTDRQPDAVARMAAPPRREPGTITPH
jgi:hypothetical protein